MLRGYFTVATGLRITGGDEMASGEIHATITFADTLTEREKNLISKVFQNYYCMGLSEIAEEDETAKRVFQKVGLI